MFLGSQNGEYVRRHQALARQSLAASEAAQRWPRAFLDDAKKMTDDALLHRGESITRHIRQKIAMQHDLLRHQESPVRSDYCTEKAMYTVFASTVITGSMAEVLSVFSCDAQLGFQAFLARIFGAELVEVKTARRLATGVSSIGDDDDSYDNMTVVSDVTSQDDRDDARTAKARSVAGAIKHAKFETKRLFSRTRHDLVFLDAMQQPSPTSILRAFKSLDNPQAYRMTDVKCKLQHVTHLLFGYHLEEVRTDRVQIAFYGNHFGPKPSSPCFAYHVLHRLAKGLAILADTVVRRRLAAHLTTVDASALHSNVCTRCVKNVALRKQVVCRICGLNFCNDCSTIERVESASGTTFDLRVCLVCYEQCKAKYILTNKILATTSLAATRASTSTASTTSHPTNSFPRRQPATPSQQPRPRRPSSRQQRVSLAGKQLVQALKHSKISTHEELLHRISELSEDSSNGSFCQTDVMQLLQSLPEESTTPKNLRHSFMAEEPAATPTGGAQDPPANPRPKMNIWPSFSTPRGTADAPRGGGFTTPRASTAPRHNNRFGRHSGSRPMDDTPRQAPIATQSLPRPAVPQPKAVVMPSAPRPRPPSPKKAAAAPMARTRSSLQLDVPLNGSQEAEMLRQNIFLDHDMNALLDRLCEALMREVDVAQVYVCCLYRAQCILKAASGENVPNQILPNCPFNAVVLEARRPTFVSDAAVDPRLASSPRVTGPEAIRFFYGVPLVTADGIELGTLSIADDMPRGRMAPKATNAIMHAATEIVALMEQRSRIALL
ncbi:hypothetical protein ACHHYP_15485 [Achlya hypogyna]|uniref:FYVE-type domain-containing protein n=1 Tax=Achlya hypogyna TaxID=1202772 RepID=A0A1V9ZET7_ACHHY|nr:hypothetical protein ACHHYP_15485 [Achlya hypogyna]